MYVYNNPNKILVKLFNDSTTEITKTPLHKVGFTNKSSKSKLIVLVNLGAELADM